MPTYSISMWLSLSAAWEARSPNPLVLVAVLVPVLHRHALEPGHQQHTSTAGSTHHPSDPMMEKIYLPMTHVLLDCVSDEEAMYLLRAAQDESQATRRIHDQINDQGPAHGEEDAHSTLFLSANRRAESDGGEALESDPPPPLEHRQYHDIERNPSAEGFPPEVPQYPITQLAMAQVPHHTSPGSPAPRTQRPSGDGDSAQAGTGAGGLAEAGPLRERTEWDTRNRVIWDLFWRRVLSEANRRLRELAAGAGAGAGAGPVVVDGHRLPPGTSFAGVASVHLLYHSLRHFKAYLVESQRSCGLATTAGTSFVQFSTTAAQGRDQGTPQNTTGIHPTLVEVLELDSQYLSAAMPDPDLIPTTAKFTPTELFRQLNLRVGSGEEQCIQRASNFVFVRDTLLDCRAAIELCQRFPDPAAPPLVHAKTLSMR
jgi:hypothetical protein